MITIDGTKYNVGVISFKRTADFLDKAAGRTESGDLYRELIGVYFNYKLTLGWSYDDPDSYNSLWSKLSEPNEFHTVTVPDGSRDSYTFQAYFANVSDELFLCRNGHNYWKGLTVDFIAKSPARS